MDTPRSWQSSGVWVHLLDLYRQLGLQSQKGRAGRWLSHGWTAWQKLATEVCCLPENHIRDAVPRVASGLPLPIAVDDEKVLGQKSVSAVALVALLARWSCGGGKHTGAMHTAPDSVSCGAALDGLVGHAAQLMGALSLHLAGAAWHPPLLPSGDGHIILKVENGAIVTGIVGGVSAG